MGFKEKRARAEIIRNLVDNSGIPKQDVAKRFGLTPSGVSRIVNPRDAASVAARKLVRKEKIAADVRLIRESEEEGVPLRQVADEHGVPRWRLWRAALLLRRGKVPKDIACVPPPDRDEDV